MKKGIAVFCTVFILLSSGYAQSNRLGVSITPQYGFFNQKGFFDKSVKGKGFIFNGSAYYERKWDVYGFFVGLGYTQLNTHFTETGIKTTHKRGFVSVPIGGSYDFDITDNFFIGVHAAYGFNYLISEKLNIGGVETPIESGKKWYSLYSGGLNFTYLFSDEVGISVMPTFSVYTVLDPSVPAYCGVGAQIRFFYAFGY